MISMDTVDHRALTVFLDIDGTCVKHMGELEDMISKPMELLPGVVEKIHEWINNGNCVVLTTARSEEYRDRTIEQLQECGIVYHQLVMGITAGRRVVINDEKPEEGRTPIQRVSAAAITLKRDRGFGDLVLDRMQPMCHYIDYTW